MQCYHSLMHGAAISGASSDEMESREEQPLDPTFDHGDGTQPPPSEVLTVRAEESADIENDGRVGMRDHRLRRRAGFLLVGGESRRMGRDKALLPIGARPLAADLADRISAVTGG